MKIRPENWFRERRRRQRVMNPVAEQRQDLIKLLWQVSFLCSPHSGSGHAGITHKTLGKSGTKALSLVLKPFSLLVSSFRHTNWEYLVIKRVDSFNRLEDTQLNSLSDHTRDFNVLLKQILYCHTQRTLNEKVGRFRTFYRPWRPLKGVEV
jgi:hypothetical protein